MKPFDDVQSALVFMVSPENENGIVVKNARGRLRSFPVELEISLPVRADELRVIPLILFDAVVLARSQLNFIISIVSSESVYEVVMVYISKESFLRRHLSQHFDGLAVIQQVRVLVAIASHHVDVLSVCVEHNSLVGREVFPVPPDGLPLIVVSRFRSFNSFRVTAVTFILVVGFDFLLVDVDDVQIEFSYFLATVLEPKDLQKVVHVKAVLVSVALEQLSLRNDVVLGFFLLLFIHKVRALSGFMTRLSQIWRDSDEVLRAALGVSYGSVKTNWLHLSNWR